MKFRNMAMKYYPMHANMGDGGDGGGAGGDGGGGGTGDGNGNQGGGNNNDGNLISHDTLWQSGDSNANANNDGSGGQQQQQQTVDHNAAFQAHIDGLDFNNGIDINAGMEAIRNGDQEAFATLLKQVGANAYKQSMLDANKVIQQRVAKMGEEVQTNVSASQSASEVVNEMGNQLPFTKSPAYAPVAKLVLTQFLEKGATPANAIAEVGKYFQGLSGEVGKLNPGAPSGRPSGNFGGVGGNQGDGNEGGEPDWMQILGGPAIQ